MVERINAIGFELFVEEARKEPNTNLVLSPFGLVLQLAQLYALSEPAQREKLSRFLGWEDLSAEKILTGLLAIFERVNLASSYRLNLQAMPALPANGASLSSLLDVFRTKAAESTDCGSTAESHALVQSLQYEMLFRANGLFIIDGESRFHGDDTSSSVSATGSYDFRGLSLLTRGGFPGGILEESAMALESQTEQAHQSVFILSTRAVSGFHFGTRAAREYSILSQLSHYQRQFTQLDSKKYGFYSSVSVVLPHFRLSASTDILEYLRRKGVMADESGISSRSCAGISFSQTALPTASALSENLKSEVSQFREYIFDPFFVIVKDKETGVNMVMAAVRKPE